MDYYHTQVLQASYWKFLFSESFPHRLVATPTALLHIEVEGSGTYAKLEICEPSCTNVDHPGHHPGHQAHQKHTHPS